MPAAQLRGAGVALLMLFLSVLPARAGSVPLRTSLMAGGGRPSEETAPPEASPPEASPAEPSPAEAAADAPGAFLLADPSAPVTALNASGTPPSSSPIVIPLPSPLRTAAAGLGALVAAAAIRRTLRLA
jgi:hypothetical protein